MNKITLRSSSPLRRGRIMRRPFAPILIVSLFSYPSVLRALATNASEKGATLNFVISSAWYQTIWFHVAFLLGTLAVAYGAYRVLVKQLRRQQDEFREAIESIPAMAFVSRPDGYRTFVNKGWVEYTGMTAEQSLGSGWHAAIHPEDMQRVPGEWEVALAGGKSMDYEARFRRATDGKYRKFLVRGVPLRDCHGNIVRWYGILTDIEDRMRAEEALRLRSQDLQDNKAKLEEAQRVAHLGYWEWDLLTDRVTWSDETYRIYGMQPQERPLVSATLRGKVHPDDQVGISRAMEEALRSGAHYKQDGRVFRPSGEVRIVQYQGDVKRDASGRPTHMFGTVQDITDLKRAEEALRQSQFYLAEGQRLAHMGSWALDATGFTYWSSELFRVHGLDPQGKPPTAEEYLALVHPEDRSFVEQAIEKMLDDHLAFDFTKRIVRPDGEIRRVRCVSVPLTQAGTFQGFLGTEMDVTEQEELTQELQRRQAHLAEAQRLSHTGSFEWKPGSGEIIWSDEAYRICEYDRRATPTIDSIVQRVHPEDRANFLKVIDSASAGATQFEHDYRLLMPDGRVKYIHALAHRVQDASGDREFVGAAIDVTERKRAEQTLRQNQAYLAEAQKLTHTGNCAITPAGVFDYWSAQMFQIHGLEPRDKPPTEEEYLGLVHPEDREVVAEKMRKMVADRCECDFTKRIVRPDGKRRYIRCVGFPVLEGTVLKGFIGTAMDVTAQELLAQELERRQVYLEEAQKLSHTGSFGWKPDSGEIIWSDETYRIFEFDPAVTPTLDLIVQRVHPEDRATFLEVTGSASAGATDFEHTCRLLMPDGRVKYTQVVAHLVEGASGNREFVGAGSDVTERKRAEQTLRQSEVYLAEAQRLSHTGSFGWKPDTGEVIWSDETYRMFEYDRTVTPTLDLILQRIHPDDRAMFLKNNESVVQAGAKDFELTCRLMMPDGRVKYTHVVAHLMQDASGKREFVGAGSDVTESMLAEQRAEQEREKLRQLEADLAHINRVSVLGEMAASLAHEIKQPLAAAITSANTCVEWLAHEPPNLDRARAAAARIDKYGNRAAEIIDRIRSLYKKSPSQRELVDVTGIIEELLTLLKGEADRYSITMRTDLAAELPEIMADRVQLQQVFMNLMLNAIEAMQDSGGEFTVKSRVDLNRHLRFLVSDSGVGLPTENVDQIFSAFFTTKPHGSGMGLAISRSIVESHGGRLWATANAGRGATFHFTLPIDLTPTSRIVPPLPSTDVDGNQIPDESL